MEHKTTLRLVLGDQLDHAIAALENAEPARDVVVMAELWDEATYVRHHKTKIAFIFSAMRHFAADLECNGFTVCYTKLDDADNTHSITGELARAIEQYTPEKVIATEPGEYRLYQALSHWAEQQDIDVELRADNRFFATHGDFRRWADDGRKSLRMEYFYREMRKRTGFLMRDDGQPVGDQWNFDAENRKSLPDGLIPPVPPEFTPDSVTQEVLKLVEAHFGDHFGDLHPFTLAVTRDQALQALDHFINERLPLFGDYQDAMKQGRPYLYHSLLSTYINAGLLRPYEVCAAAQKAYESGSAPLNAVEGFIRQILGWREFIRGIYWYYMPDYAAMNALDAHRRLPSFYWTGETDMNCLRQCVTETRKNAYAHHIQRLMVLGNFALLAGINPKYVNEWYLIVYADAYEWVEMPNVTGMILYADGGIFASKTYAASGSYIKKMSDYCKNCVYNVSQKTGKKACPFNYLYWDFVKRNEDKLRGNHRMTMIYKTLDRMDDDKVRAMRTQAQAFLDSLHYDGDD